METSLVTRDIAGSERSAFFSRINRLYTGALVTVRVNDREQMVNQPFHGISPDEADFFIHAGDGSGRTHVAHRVANVSAIQIEQTPDGADAGLVFSSRDGTRTEVRFQSPLRADLLDPCVE